MTVPAQLNGVVHVSCGTADLAGVFAGFLAGEVKLSLEGVLKHPLFLRPLRRWPARQPRLSARRRRRPAIHSVFWGERDG